MKLCKKMSEKLIKLTTKFMTMYTRCIKIINYFKWFQKLFGISYTIRTNNAYKLSEHSLLMLQLYRSSSMMSQTEVAGHMIQRAWLGPTSANASAMRMAYFNQFYLKSFCRQGNGNTVRAVIAVVIRYSHYTPIGL